MSSSTPANFNYAHYAGIESVPAAIVFAVLYLPLFAWYVRQSISRPTYVFIMLAFFSIIRVVAFVTRAVLAGVDSAAKSRNLLIANQIIYGIGFLGLLWSAYTLVLDRELVSDTEKPRGLIPRVARNRHLYRISLSAAVILGIVGTVDLTTANGKQSDITLGNTLRKTSVIIYVVLVALLVYLTVMFVISEAKVAHSYRRGNDSFGSNHGTKILGLIAVLLLGREIFMVVTIGNLPRQQHEPYWYPFAAATEFLAVCLFITPGLVPPRSELPT
jgi:hypothetical protein